MKTCVLAGDLGGTKVNLGIYRVDEGRLEAVREKSFACRDYGGLEEMVERFASEERDRIAAAAFGVAGPVTGRTVKVTNLPWVVDPDRLGHVLDTRRVLLVNDLQATAYGALFVDREALHTLNAGKPRPGHRAVLAAGTGLGEAVLFWDGSRYVPSPSEGGHVDFAPRNDRETELLRFLRKELGRVSYERVVSGPGLVRIFRFLAEGCGKAVAPGVQERIQRDDPAAAVGEAAVAGTCPTCREAVDIFLDIYGAQAGNLALAVMAVGGVYVGGGIIAKLLPAVRRRAFMEAFTAKDPHEQLMRDMPVHVLLEHRAAQLGAAHLAAELAGVA